MIQRLDQWAAVSHYSPYTFNLDIYTRKTSSSTNECPVKIEPLPPTFFKGFIMKDPYESLPTFQGLGFGVSESKP